MTISPLIVIGAIGLLLYVIWSVRYIWFTDHTKIVEVEKTVPKETFPDTPSYDWYIQYELPTQYYWAIVYNQWQLQINPANDPKAKSIIFPEMDISASPELIWRFTEKLYGASSNQVYIHNNSIGRYSFSTYNFEDNWICVAQIL